MNRERLPSVSAVIPAFNGEKTLSLAVASAVSQDHKPRELIVVDDASIDGTAALVQRLGELDPTVRLVRRDKNGGPAAARRTGVHAASGELIAFLDADDIWLPGKLSRQIALLDDPGVDAVHAGKVDVDETLTPVRYRAARADRTEFSDFLCWVNLPCVAATLVARREVLTDDLFWDDLPAIEDWAMVVTLSFRHRVAAIPEPLVLYRLIPTGRSHNLDAQVEAGHRILAKMGSWGVDGRLQRRAYGAFYTMLCGGALHLGNPKASASWGMRAMARDPRALARIAAAPGRRARDRRRLIHSGINRSTIDGQIREQLATLGVTPRITRLGGEETKVPAPSPPPNP